MATTSKGIRYPVSSDHKRLWEHYQNMAEDVDGLLSELSPSFDSDSTDITAITNTSPAAGSPVVGTTFVAPASGQVFVTVTGFIDQTQNTKATVLGWEMRAGGVVGSGAVAVDADDNRSVICGRAVNTLAAATLSASNRYLVTGLTPGATYNVQTLHYTNASGNGNIYFRSILVEPTL